MPQTLAQVTLVVREYDEAIAFFTEQLGFRLLEDCALSGGTRWVVVEPDGPGSLRLLLARASTPEQIRTGFRGPLRQQVGSVDAFRCKRLQLIASRARAYSPTSFASITSQSSSHFISNPAAGVRAASDHYSL